MALYIATESELTSVADAIRTKGGTSSPLVFPAGFVNAIEDIPTGGTTVEPKDVNFIDYDGTIVAAYTAEEFAALDALPENPTHEGLTAQGWNWSLSDAKTYVASYGKLWVGQMYITDDGKTRLYLTLDNNALLSPTLGLAVNGSAVIDWGDGSATDTLTGSSTSTAVTVQHIYATKGEYVISIDVTGEANFVSGQYQSSEFSKILTGANINETYGYLYRINKVEIGRNIGCSDTKGLYYIGCKYLTVPNGTTITKLSFYGSPLRSLTVPSGFVGDVRLTNTRFIESISLPESGFDRFIANYAELLKTLTLPTVTSVSLDNAHSLEDITMTDATTFGLSYAYLIKSLRIPNGVTTLKDDFCNGAERLEKVTIGSGVTSIGTSAFSGARMLSEIHLLPTTPPNLGNWSGIVASCTIYVPSASLETYKTASNWSTYASQMVGE